jgi:peptidoglycan/xylan/chitin deacetylase (PgdA/CDA1 family)
MIRRRILLGTLSILLVGLAFASATVFFDQAVLVRKDTLYRADTEQKVVALTFDDGPSDIWTPQILDELKKADVKATFFMIGKHVEQYPQIARRVCEEGHEIGNHTYDHHGIFYYTPEELRDEVMKTDAALEKAAGKRTTFFRPPKAWITSDEKRQLGEMGYTVVLWTLNSKDWVTFDHKYIIRHILKDVKPGDILLFHDSGGVLGTENGDRRQTVETIAPLVAELKKRGYRFVLVSELVDDGGGSVVAR